MDADSRRRTDRGGGPRERILEALEALRDPEPQERTAAKPLSDLVDEEDIVLAAQSAEIQPEPLVLEESVEPLTLVTDPRSQLRVAVVARREVGVLDHSLTIKRERGDDSVGKLSRLELVRQVLPGEAVGSMKKDRAIERPSLSLLLDGSPKCALHEDAGSGRDVRGRGDE